MVVLPIIVKLPETVKSPEIEPPDNGSALFAVVNAAFACLNAPLAYALDELAVKKAAFACVKAPFA